MANTNIVGMKFGRLTVVEKTNTKRSGKYLYKCICDCQLTKPETEREYCYVAKNNLMSGGTRSCGCLAQENRSRIGRQNKKENRYDIFGDYVVGYTRTEDYPFIIDKADYDLVRCYCWHKHRDGYLRTQYKTYIDEQGKRHCKCILLHNLLLGRENADGSDVDHINGNPADNRRANLRIVTHSQNGMNRKLSTNNHTGCNGVSYNQRMRKYHAEVYANHKSIHLGWFDTVEEAIAARKQAEETYYGEYTRKE